MEKRIENDSAAPAGVPDSEWSHYKQALKESRRNRDAAMDEAEKYRTESEKLRKALREMVSSSGDAGAKVEEMRKLISEGFTEETPAEGVREQKAKLLSAKDKEIDMLRRELAELKGQDPAFHAAEKESERAERKARRRAEQEAQANGAALPAEGGDEASEQTAPSSSSSASKLEQKYADEKAKNKELKKMMEQWEREREEVGLLVSQLKEAMEAKATKLKDMEAIQAECDLLRQEKAEMAEMSSKFEIMYKDNLNLQEEKQRLLLKIEQNEADLKNAEAQEEELQKVTQLTEDNVQLEAAKQELLEQLDQMEEQLEQEQQQVKAYYEELSEIRADHDRVSEGYIKLSERLTNKMDELSEAHEDKEALQRENEKLTKQYLDLLKSATSDSPQKGKYAPDFE
jgi:chromosome segregation protein